MCVCGGGVAIHGMVCIKYEVGGGGGGIGLSTRGAEPVWGAGYGVYGRVLGCLGRGAPYPSPCCLVILTVPQRAELTKLLIAERGFTAVVVESDWPDAARVNRYVRGLPRPEEAAAAAADVAAAAAAAAEVPAGRAGAGKTAGHKPGYDASAEEALSDYKVCVFGGGGAWTRVTDACGASTGAL